ncbi:coiled-coil domain-containing protein 106-like [Gymnodraco acuticeps]|uniref:Coiled-coil domain-containing protein 106-like n=1 Tax=Gymnodraco acuticeps TaxID=8218 RepID=A0A6P8VGT2_GYMAC|nr:coiled-coil domain-containing protein 106-like [Gymnodraco acuticeps]
MPVKQHIAWRKKAEMLQSQVDELEEENGILKQQLEDNNSIQEQDGNLEVMATGDKEPEPMRLDSSTDSSNDSSTDSSTDSSSTSDSSDEGKKKKKQKKKGKKRSKKGKKESKKAKTSKGKVERVSSISDVVGRYRRVLRLVQRGFKMTKAFKKAHVSRNAVKDTAAIAEVFLVDKSVLDQFKGKTTLLKLAQLCQKKIVGELAEKIAEMKSNKQLIPFSVR